MVKRVVFSTLWVFITVNYIFCDVFTLLNTPELNQFIKGSIGDIELTQGFLLTFAIIKELAVIMMVLSRVLKYALNGWLNIIAGIAFTLIQAGTFEDGDFILHYLFFSIAGN